LAGLGRAGPPAGPVGHVVEPQLEHAQEVLSRDPGLVGGLLVEVDELLLEHAVDAAGLLLLAELGEVLGSLADAVAPVLTRWVGPALDRALHRVALGPLEEQLHLLPAAQAADGAGVSGDWLGCSPPSPRRGRSGLGGGHPRRRFLGRQPLWGMGVTSLMPDTSMPVLVRERMAVSRPDPGPLTSTSTLRTPCSM